MANHSRVNFIIEEVRNYRPHMIQHSSEWKEEPTLERRDLKIALVISNSVKN